MGYEAGDRLATHVGGISAATLVGIAMIAGGAGILAGWVLFQGVRPGCGSAGPACPFSLSPSEGGWGFVATLLTIVGFVGLIVPPLLYAWSTRGGALRPDPSPRPPAPHAPAWGTDEEERWNGPLP